VLRNGEDTNDPLARAYGLRPLIEVNDRQGRFEECISNSKMLIEVSEATQLHEFRVIAGCILHRCYVRLGETQKSLEVLRKTDVYRIRHRVNLNAQRVLLGYFRLYLAAAERAGEEERVKWVKSAKRARKKMPNSARLHRIHLPEATRLQGAYDWLTNKQVSAQKHWQHSISLQKEWVCAMSLP
jgi:hypothetical protein